VVSLVGNWGPPQYYYHQRIKSVGTVTNGGRSSASCFITMIVVKKDKTMITKNCQAFSDYFVDKISKLQSAVRDRLHRLNSAGLIRPPTQRSWFFIFSNCPLLLGKCRNYSTQFLLNHPIWILFPPPSSWQCLIRSLKLLLTWLIYPSVRGDSLLSLSQCPQHLCLKVTNWIRQHLPAIGFLI